jgi:hypothetical protein
MLTCIATYGRPSLDAIYGCCRLTMLLSFISMRTLSFFAERHYRDRVSGFMSPFLANRRQKSSQQPAELMMFGHLVLYQRLLPQRLEWESAVMRKKREKELICGGDASHEVCPRGTRVAAPPKRTLNLTRRTAFL